MLSAALNWIQRLEVMARKRQKRKHLFHKVKGRGSSSVLLLVLFSCGIPSAPYLPPVPSNSVESPLSAETDYYFSIPDPATINPEVFELSLIHI